MNKKHERLLLLSVALFWFSIYTYPSFLSSYCQDTLGISAVMVGTITGSYGLLQLICRIPLGILSDRFQKRKPFVMLGMGASVLASAGFMLVGLLADEGSSWAATAALICRALSGVTASAWVTLSVMYTSGYGKDDVNAAMSRIMLPNYAAQMIAMLAGAQLASHVGPWSAFALALLGGIAGMIVLAMVPDIKPEGKPLTLRGFAEVARDRSLLTGTALGTLLQFVSWATILGFVQNWAKDVLALDTTFLGWLQFINLLPAAILSRLSGEYIVKKIGLRATWVGGFAVLAVACCLYSATDSALTLALVQALFGVGSGLIYPLTMASAVKDISDDKRGLAMGLYQAVYGVGMFLGPVVAGAIIGHAGGGVVGYQANFMLSGGIAVIGAVWAFFLSRTKKKEA